MRYEQEQPNTRVGDYLNDGPMAYNRADDYFYMQAIEQIAAKRVYKRFRVTARELNMLVGLAACLVLKNKRVISKDLYLDWIGGNRQFNRNAWYYLRCLIDKGCLHRLRWRNVRPGSEGNSLAISRYGARVLEYFHSEVDQIDLSDQARKAGNSYMQMIVNSDCIPQGYTLNQAGRND